MIDPGAQDHTTVPVGRSNYQFLGEIARGGMGVILEGHDTDPGPRRGSQGVDQRTANRPEVVQPLRRRGPNRRPTAAPGIVPVYELGTMRTSVPSSP
ncbi:MAG: hypothetical protein IPK67_18225 [Planctomycetes bacterium]|nr:hypothetical protein [Planctomycetota bacterium]